MSRTACAAWLGARSALPVRAPRARALRQSVPRRVSVRPEPPLEAPGRLPRAAAPTLCFGLFLSTRFCLLGVRGHDVSGVISGVIIYSKASCTAASSSSLAAAVLARVWLERLARVARGGGAKELQRAMGANTTGGEHFRAGRFSEAVKCYSGGIEADSEPSELAKLLANRSAAYGRLGNLEAALADGKRAVEIDPSYIKGYFRATKAHMALGQFRRASAMASEGLSRAPDNKELQQALQDANSEGANSPAPPSGRRAKRATTPASPPSTITPVVPARTEGSPAARTEGSPRRTSGAHAAELEAVELKARLADVETRAEERVQLAEAHAHAHVAQAARHGPSAQLAAATRPCRNHTPARPPRAVSRAQGCPLGAQGEPSPHGC